MRYLRYSVNSTAELEYHALSAREKRAISERDHERVQNRLVEVRKMLYGLIKKVKESNE